MSERAWCVCVRVRGVCVCVCVWCVCVRTHRETEHRETERERKRKVRARKTTQLAVSDSKLLKQSANVLNSASLPQYAQNSTYQ